MACKVLDTIIPGSANKFPVVDVVNVSIKEQYLDAYLDNLNGTITALSTTVENLTKRIAALENGTVATLDKTTINSLISQADGLEEDEYTISSWESLDVAYKAAENARDNATTQGELDEAASALEQAINNLIKRITFTISGASYTADPDMTWFAWANNEGYNTSQNPEITCSSDTANVYYGELRILSGTSYVLGNQKISSNGSYTIETQSTEVDKTALEAAIREAEQTIEGEEETDYTSDSWTNLENALGAAQTVYYKTSSTQVEVDNATQTLTNATNALVYIATLADEISEVNKLNETDYSKPSWAELKEAKTTAETVYADSTATQTRVNEAITNLQTARNNLLDISDLEAAIDRAQGYNEADYTSDSWEVLETALVNAQSVLNSANANIEGETQTSVNDAAANLNNACASLVPDNSQEEPTPTGIVDTIIANEMPMYQVDESGELAEVSYKLLNFDTTTAAVAATESGFYQIKDTAGNVIESGYQHASNPNDSMYYVIVLPKEMDFSTNVSVQSWDALQNEWSSDRVVMSNDLAMIERAFTDAGLTLPEYDTEKYTLWLDASLDTCSGIDYRFIINE